MTGSYRTCKYVIQATATNSPSGYQATEILVTHNDTDAFATQYATVDTVIGGELCTYDVDIHSSQVRLIASSSQQVSLKYDRTIIPV